MTYSTRDLAAATPVDRDRYVDLLRVAALGVVMLAHFFVVGVEVMPVFFAVGGFSNAVAWTSYQRRGGSYADFMISRAERLLRPTSAFIVAGLAIGVVGEASGHLTQTAVMVLRVVALAPPMYALHRRWGDGYLHCS